MGKSRTKSCPDCGMSVPYSCVICECGGTIKSTRSSAIAKSSGNDRLQRRRTERTKRDKPNFYDSFKYDKKIKKEKEERKKEVKQQPEKVIVKEPSPVPQFVPQRMQLTVKRVAEEPEVKEEELEEIVLSEEKIAKFSLILDEINRKICASSWKGIL